jgi:beta-phosphoglucomutase-like phosphatase (HAD superfamily)
VARGKPAPDLFLYAAKTMGADPSRAVVVEDSVVGIKAAKSAGMLAIGFVGGLHHMPPSDQALIAAGADHIAQTMEDVQALITA